MLGFLLGSRAGWRRWITIGIRKEDKSVWEARAPLSPRHIKSLLQKHPTIKIVIQPSTTRVFTDQEYLEVGAKIEQDLSLCDTILSVKEVPRSQILPGKRYMCFSHTHKGQSHNMSMLRTFVEQKCDLIDYELLKDEQGRRLVAFGKFAGYAGMINCLHGLGLQLLSRGFRTPFLNIAPSHIYSTLEEARSSIRRVAKDIARNGLPHQLQPLLLVFTGNGNVSQGAQELANELQIKFLDVNRIPTDLYSDGTIFGCVLEAKDYCQHLDGQQFSMAEYLANPERFRSIFVERLAPYTTALINGIYWEANFPRLLTIQDADKLLTNPASKLVTIADISCDIAGSIEITHRSSTIAEPFYYYPSNKTTQNLQIMAVDNLPAQLPRDATEYFGDHLLSLLDGMIKKDVFAVNTFKKAAIVSNGILTEQHQWLNTIVSNAKRRVLVLGSGYVVGPVIKYFGEHSNDTELVIASNAPVEAERLAKSAPNSAIVEQLDITDSQKLRKLVGASDIVISLIPATMHLPVAEACLDKSKSLVTASYISPAMQKLDELARAKGLIFLNEIGLDPGLDHLSAKKIIDQVSQQGKRVNSFVSWCGGLPAPEAANNPLGYKFSWSPRAVLLAALNDARYLWNGQQVQVPGKRLLASALPNPFASRFNLEGVPNRDSLKYVPLYGLEGISTMLRGTLRYKGFCSLMQCFQTLGLLSLEPLPMELQKKDLTWSQIMTEFLLPKGLDRALASGDLTQDRLFSALEWLGMFSSEEPFDARALTMLDAFCELLQRKLAFKEGELDLVVMQHEFVITTGDVTSKANEYISSSLIEYGQRDKGGFSAMARTVGYPVAVASEMILDGRWSGMSGVLAPLSPHMYNPLLEKLEKVAGIRFTENRTTFPSSIL